MHPEFIAADLATVEALARDDRRVIAVGTTSVRTLESLYHLGCMAARGEELREVPQWYPYSPDHPRLEAAEALSALAERMRSRGISRLIGSTRIIIAPGYPLTALPTPLFLITLHCFYSTHYFTLYG